MHAQNHNKTIYILFVAMIEIKTESMFAAAITKPLVLVDFYASWCNPCRVLTPLLDEMSKSNKYSSVIFTKVDVDKMDSIAERYRVTAMPTLILLQYGKEVARIVGVDKEKIIRTLEKYMHH